MDLVVLATGFASIAGAMVMLAFRRQWLAFEERFYSNLPERMRKPWARFHAVEYALLVGLFILVGVVLIVVSLLQ